MLVLGIVALTLPGVSLPKRKVGTPPTPASAQPRPRLTSSSHSANGANSYPRVKKDRLAETRRILEFRMKTLGAAHPDTIEVMRELARSLHNSRITEYRHEGFALDQKLKMMYAKPRAEEQTRTKPQAKQSHSADKRRAKPVMWSTAGNTGLVRMPQPKQPLGTSERRAKLHPGFKPSYSAKLLNPAPTARTPQPPFARPPFRKKFLPAAASHARAQPLPPRQRSAGGLPPPRHRQACALPHHARPVEMMNCSADGNIERRRWCINCVLS